MEKIKVNYADWSNNTTDISAWRRADLALDVNENGDLEFFLTRQSPLKNTFFFEVGENQLATFLELVKRKVVTLAPDEADQLRNELNKAAQMNADLRNERDELLERIAMEKVLKMEDLRILIVGDRCWGMGKTLDEALEKAKTNAHLKAKPSVYIAYMAEEGTRIDEVGDFVLPTHGRRPVEFHRKGI